MTDHDQDDDNDASFDRALQSLLQAADEPDDAGFSLRVMATLPARVSPRQLRWAQWIQRGQWAAISLAACGVAVLLSGQAASPDRPHAAAAMALTGLLIFWSIPSRWSRG